MKATPTAIPEVVLVEPAVFGDARGFFYESWNRNAFAAAIGRDAEFVQDNQSLCFHATDNDLVIAYSKRSDDDVILCVVNLDPFHVHRAWLDLDLARLGLADDTAFQVHDLLSDARFT